MAAFLRYRRLSGGGRGHCVSASLAGWGVGEGMGNCGGRGKRDIGFPPAREWGRRVTDTTRAERRGRGGGRLASRPYGGRGEDGDPTRPRPTVGPCFRRGDEFLYNGGGWIASRRYEDRDARPFDRLRVRGGGRPAGRPYGGFWWRGEVGRGALDSCLRGNRGGITPIQTFPRQGGGGKGVLPGDFRCIILGTFTQTEGEGESWLKG